MGKAPPDMTVIARSKRPDYIYTLLKSYYVDESRALGWNNLAYPNIGMPHVLWEQQGAREASAKLALLEARLAETALQRTQIEELIQGLARSRDENVLADIDAALRVALQQSAITGSVEPLVATLRQADERLARFNQPRLERVRRAVAQDLERARNAGVTDFAGLAIRLDEVIRQIDELPLLATPDKRGRPQAPTFASG
jgi:uroporphyrin-3 C-methyltransferase